jgi:hypothetical protein
MSLNALLQGGKPHAAVSSDPAANTEASIDVPAGETWVILAAHISCVQGATQTPLPSLVVTDSDSNTVGNYAGASAAQSASVTATYDWYPGCDMTAGAGATANRAPIPEGLAVKGGWNVATSTSGKGANTNLGALSLHVIKL